ncbi:MAG: hypothetical protein RJA57_939 [Bacteroidota bacterium]|jgi:hypothetical protein
MKLWIHIIGLLLLPCTTLLAQPEGPEPPPQEGRIRERMQQYIQKKLSLSPNEAERFSPVFVRYFREFSQTHRSYRGDRLVLQQKIIDLRIRYRSEFRQIMDEQRANKVFRFEDEFRHEAIRIIRENRQERIDRRPQMRRNRGMGNE